MTLWDHIRSDEQVANLLPSNQWNAVNFYIDKTQPGLSSEARGELLGSYARRLKSGDEALANQIQSFYEMGMKQMACEAGPNDLPNLELARISVSPEECQALRNTPSMPFLHDAQGQKR